MKRKLFGTRRRIVVVAVIAALSVTSTAIAGWIVFSGGHGSASGKITSSVTTNDAITVQPDAVSTSLCDPSASPADCTLYAQVKNNAGVSETITGGSATITAVPSTCAQYLHFSSANVAADNIVIGAGLSSFTSQPIAHAVTIDANTPASCAGATFNAALTLTTTP